MKNEWFFFWPDKKKSGYYSIYLYILQIFICTNIERIHSLKYKIKSSIKTNLYFIIIKKFKLIFQSTQADIILSVHKNNSIFYNNSS